MFCHHVELWAKSLFNSCRVQANNLNKAWVWDTLWYRSYETRVWFEPRICQVCLYQIKQGLNRLNQKRAIEWQGCFIKRWLSLVQSRYIEYVSSSTRDMALASWEVYTYPWLGEEWGCFIFGRLQEDCFFEKLRKGEREIVEGFLFK